MKRMAPMLLLVALIPVAQADDSPPNQETMLEIVSVRFEPLQQGKNVVHVEVRNPSDRDQMFRTHMYSRSPEYGRNGVGWGAGFFATIPAESTTSTRFVFKIQGPLTDSTYVRLTFSDLGTAAEFDEETWNQNQRWRQFFRKTTYSAADLTWRQDDSNQAGPADAEHADAIVAAFTDIQDALRAGDYDRAWLRFTADYQQAEFQSTDVARFVKTMVPEKPIEGAFTWEKASFVRLTPVSVLKIGERFRLFAEDDDQTWTIDFVEADGRWKVAWIAGFTPRFLQWQDWEKHVLPRMDHRQTAHFDIYYYPDSTAARQIDKIAHDKEKGLAEIAEFLGQAPKMRIKLVFFEDKASKHLQTGHQGMGWAYNRTIVEVYNQAEQLDPFHETVHILAGPIGHPPALFTEGFAVYMSEHLGAHALEDLSGGLATIDERARQLQQQGDWIELAKLIDYTEIGSPESRPPVAYAEAASFVKFLIEQFGKERFLQTYRRLINSDDPQDHERNRKILKDTYDATLAELDQRWQEGIRHGNL